MPRGKAGQSSCDQREQESCRSKSMSNGESRGASPYLGKGHGITASIFGHNPFLLKQKLCQTDHKRELDKNNVQKFQHDNQNIKTDFQMQVKQQTKIVSFYLFMYTIPAVPCTVGEVELNVQPVIDD